MMVVVVRKCAGFVVVVWDLRIEFCDEIWDGKIGWI
jgi:hypothetical protein